MAVPKSVTKVKKGNVEFVSSVDRVSYTITELSRAALRDSAKYIRNKIIQEIRKLPGMSRSKWPYYVVNTWVRKRETDLMIGFGHNKKGHSGDFWFAVRQELGTSGRVGPGGSRRAAMPQRSILRRTVYDNIYQIRIIQGQYLSAISDENKALGLIDHDGNEYENKDGIDG